MTAADSFVIPRSVSELATSRGEVHCRGHSRPDLLRPETDEDPETKNQSARGKAGMRRYIPEQLPSLWGLPAISSPPRRGRRPLISPPLTRALYSNVCTGPRQNTASPLAGCVSVRMSRISRDCRGQIHRVLFGEHETLPRGVEIDRSSSTLPSRR